MLPQDCVCFLAFMALSRSPCVITLELPFLVPSEEELLAFSSSSMSSNVLPLFSSTDLGVAITEFPLLSSSIFIRSTLFTILVKL